MAVERHPSPDQDSFAALLATLDSEPIEEGLAGAARAIAATVGALTALFIVEPGEVLGEHWSLEPDRVAASLHDSFREAAAGALADRESIHPGNAHEARPSANGTPRVWCASAEGTTRVVCATAAGPLEKRAEAWVEHALTLVAWRLAARGEATRARATRAQYERWFRTLDEQLRVLDRERQKFSAIVHRSDVRVFVTDPSRAVSWTNAMMGAPPGPESPPTWLGLACRDVCSEFEGRRPSADCADCPVRRALDTNRVVHREFRQEDADGVRDLYLSALPIKGPDGRPQEAMVMIQDLSDLEILRKSESRYRLLFERSGKAIVVVELARGRILLANPMASKMTGHAREELLATDLASLHPADEWARLEQAYRAAFASGGLAPRDCRVRARDGAERLATVSGTRYDLEGQDAMMLEFQDVTEAREVQEALYKTKERLRTVIVNAPVVLFALDHEGTFTLSEGRGLAALGLEAGEVVGRSAYEFYGDVPEAIDNLHRAMAGQEFTSVVEVGGLAFETCYSPLRDAGGTVIGVIGVATDVTDRRRLEHQLRHAQRIEALGRLAGGVAHDFNNLLAAILGHGEILASRLSPGDPARRHVDEIRKAGDRGALLTRQLLSFSRREMLMPTVLDVNAVVLGMDDMLRRLIGEDIDLVTLPAGEPALVKADRGQIEQVVLNLAVNARDAMPRGGRLTIEVGLVELDRAYAQTHAGVTPGPHVVVAVSDTGCGMDAATLPHIFEPFFTTKERGRGTGLGLATVYGIVEQCAGHLWVYSEPNIGTTFKTHLPRSSETTPAAVPAALAGPPRGGAETVLLVEDEDPVRAMTREILEDNGYSVLEAPHGAEAIRVAEAYPGTIDLLLTDVVMPHMGGGPLAQHLTARRPGLRVLFVSGYSDDAIVRHGVLERGSAFLQKPYALDVLVRRVREVLDAPPRAAA